jgi:hypothetical protein
MTVALGLVAWDGIVLAADMQESDGYFKEYGVKISSDAMDSRVDSNMRAAIGITGAGPAVHLDAIAEQIIGGFHAHQFQSLNDFETWTGEVVADFYKKHVVDIAPHVDRDFRLIIGAQIENRCALWTSDATVIKRVPTLEAVGSGAPFAKMALEARSISPNVELGILLAILGVARAREYDIHSGKGTHIVCLRDNITHIVPWFRVNQVEELFRRYAGIEFSAFQYATGHRMTSEGQHPGKIAKWLEELRADFRKVASENLTES